ncbi:MAG: hypothetical protein AVDCRST_MAG56-7946 [uncultured Cytophagales bacterium]|uniref:Uncharacterized protein n=1 Tax=uncultured Cytophagales bacterium TaxID=158755 RepID=A0A6J4LUF8_9SPHI|nr:MAG: hypothetical protein AVDCRST_MAG56-7946 [uncultured Cytophagales bacterium]
MAKQGRKGQLNPIFKAIIPLITSRGALLAIGAGVVGTAALAAAFASGRRHAVREQLSEAAGSLVPAIKGVNT